jgi:hypothetical protein
MTRSLDRYQGSRGSDGTCAALLNQAPQEEEVCLTRSTSPRILFGGDSHAMALYSAVFGGGMPLDAALIAAHGCALYAQLDYTPVRGNNWGNRCTEVAKSLLEFLRTNTSVKTIVMTNAYALVDERPSRFSLRGRTLTNREAFQEGNARMLEALFKRVDHVVFVVDVPHLRHDPRSCVRRVPFAEPLDCRLSAQEHATMRRSYMDAVDALQARFPRLVVYDPARLLCASGMCRDREGEPDSDFLYNDTHHLSFAGSKLILRAMQEGALL